MAKKKGGPKSGAIAAKEAELAKEAEILRQQQETERLRNEELRLRQRIEEEEQKMLEHLRIRNETISNAIAERARDSNYKAKERELVEAIECKNRDIEELRAKVKGLQLAYETMERERESAFRRTSMLTNELELAQVNHLELSALMDEKEKRYQENIQKREQLYDELQKSMAALRAEHGLLLEKNKELKDQLANMPSLSVAKPLNPDGSAVEGEEESKPTNPVDAETAVLLKVLHSEVDKYKEKALQLQRDIDAQCRDEEKSSLLVGILNSQLDAVREENKRLYQTAQNRLKEVEATQLLYDEEHKKNKQLYEEMDKLASEAAVQQRQLQLEVEVHKTQVNQLTDSIANLRHHHELLEAEHKDYVQRATEREQQDFKANEMMKSEVMKHKADLSMMLQEKQKLQDESFNFKVLNRTEMDGLKARLRKFEEEAERKDRESYEIVTVLRADVEKYKNDKKLLVDSFNAERGRLLDDAERFIKTLNGLQREHEELKRHSTQVQKDLYEKLTHITACHDSKHEEVERLRKSNEEKEAEYTNNIVFLNATNENLKSRVETLKQEAEERREEHIRHVQEMKTEFEALQQCVSKELGEMNEAKLAEQERAELAERNVKRLQEQCREQADNLRGEKEDHALEVRVMSKEMKELRHELSLAKKTVQRLEGALGDQASFKQLTELNEKLSEENGHHQAVIAGLNSTIASMKMEGDYLEHLRMQQLGEEKAQLQRQNQALERLHTLTLPLVRELRTLLSNHGMTRAMESSLERYDVLIRRCGIPVEEKGQMSQGTRGADEADAAAGLPRMSHPSPPKGEAEGMTRGSLPSKKNPSSRELPPL